VIVSFEIERTIWLCFDWVESHVARRRADLGIYHLTHRRSEHDL
jgi:hypothetical protein